MLKHKVVDEKIKRIPSIFGRDILNKYRLIFDRKDGTAIITDERDEYTVNFSLQEDCDIPSLTDLENYTA